MSEPVIAQRAPFPVEVEEGKTYFWCVCGKSSKHPFQPVRRTLTRV